MLGAIWGVIQFGQIRAIVIRGDMYMFFDTDPDMDAFVTGCQPIIPPVFVKNNVSLCVLMIVTQESLKLLPNYTLANIVLA
jgi:hypothetical protein